MLTREQVVEAIRPIAEPDSDSGADRVAVRDIVVKDGQVSLTVLTPSGQPVGPFAVVQTVPDTGSGGAADSDAPAER